MLLPGALQLDLYQNKDILFIYAKGKDENRRCGRLHFRLSYDFDKSDFIVHVIEGLCFVFINLNIHSLAKERKMGQYAMQDATRKS